MAETVEGARRLFGDVGADGGEDADPKEDVVGRMYGADEVDDDEFERAIDKSSS